MTDTPTDLAELRRELRFSRSYVSDDLASDIATWIMESYRRQDADTAREYVEHQLNNLLRTYPMYNAPDVDNGHEAFPDRCSDCRHYGAACPVLTDGVQELWRERRLEAADGEKAARRVYEQQSRDVGCVLIPELLETWDDQISGFMARGERLLRRVEAEESTPAGETAPDDLDPADVDDALANAGLDDVPGAVDGGALADGAGGDNGGGGA